MKKRIFLLLIFLFIFFSSPMLHGAIPAQQRAALTAFYNATGGDSWTDNSGWKTPPLDADGFAMPGTESGWYGLSISGDNIIQIDLGGNNLTGSLPAEIGNLPQLSYLLLNNNDLAGSIPAEIGNLSNLRYLWLSGNRIGGSFPTALTTLTNLSNLNLSSNNLGGSLPSNLGDMSSLSSLSLSYNHIYGSIPSSVGSLLQLTSLNLGNNQFYGNIPTSIKDLANLKFLSLDNNWLSGSIPPEIGDLTALIFLHLNSNSLTGSIPPEIGKLSNLMILELQFNYLSGPIPPELGNLDNLNKLDFKKNQLTGTLPPELGDMDKINTLRFSFNKLTGPIPESITTNSTLRYLYLGANNFVGPVPESLMNLSAAYYIELNQNGFYTDNEKLKSFLEIKSPYWSASQTIPPADVSGTAGSLTSITLTWTPIEFTTGTGGYQIYSSTVSGSGYVPAGETADKSASSFTVNDLTPDTTYYFIIRTRTDASINNQNEIISDPGAEISVKTPAPAVDQYILYLQSSPATGVSITVSPNDVNGSGSGQTSFSRLFNAGTPVTVTASAEHNGESFLNWTVDGIKITTNPLTLNMDGNHTVIAYYNSPVPVSTLTVHSSPDSGVPVSVSPNDNNGGGNGRTSFTRTYNTGEPVTLTAPAEQNGRTFQKWTVDGVTKNGNPISVIMNADHTATAFYEEKEEPPVTGAILGLSRTSFNFGSVGAIVTPAQDMRVTITGTAVAWNSSADVSWLELSPGSGSGTTNASISVNPSGLSPGRYAGKVTVTAPEAEESPRTVSVVLNVYTADAVEGPAGFIETPRDNSTVYGSIAVTGWAVDEIGVTRVKIYYDTGNPANRVYLDDALLVEGARPDVESAFPEYPRCHLAGWGYMLLTNYLPNKGNGTFTLHASAMDVEGYEVFLGTKTITADNANAVKPFGAIDTPGQGGVASGSGFVNWGWVLTPMPNKIPEDGSTIVVLIDGKKVGNAVYNLPRGDIAKFFPGYANTGGPAGYFTIDTTANENKVHTIQWTVTDKTGNSDGIGSRFFKIDNMGTSRLSTLLSGNSGSIPGLRVSNRIETDGPCDKYTKSIKAVCDTLPLSSAPVRAAVGYNLNREPQTVFPGNDGSFTIEINEMGRLELYLERSLPGSGPDKSSRSHGFQRFGGELRPLPPGSYLDGGNGIFYWQPGAGFYGPYRFEFIVPAPDGKMLRKPVIIIIKSKK